MVLRFRKIISLIPGKQVTIPRTEIETVLWCGAISFKWKFQKVVKSTHFQK